MTKNFLFEKLLISVKFLSNLDDLMFEEPSFENFEFLQPEVLKQEVILFYFPLF